MFKANKSKKQKKENKWEFVFRRIECAAAKGIGAFEFVTTTMELLRKSTS